MPVYQGAEEEMFEIMTKHLRIPVAIALAALLAPLVFAQSSTTTAATPPTAADIVAGRVAFLTKLLDLTDAQQAQATTIFTTEQAALDALKTSMDTEQSALQTAVQNSSSSGIGAAAAQIGALTAQQIVATASADVAFYAILTADQQTKYSSLQQAGVGGPQGGPPQGAPPQGPPPQGPPPQGSGSSGTSSGSSGTSQKGR